MLKHLYSIGNNVIRNIYKFIHLGQMETQMLVVLLCQTTMAICNVFLMVHQFSLLKQKQLI